MADISLRDAVDAVNSAQRRPGDPPLVFLAQCERCGEEFAQLPQDWARSEQGVPRICRFCVTPFRTETRRGGGNPHPWTESETDRLIVIAADVENRRRSPTEGATVLAREMGISMSQAGSALTVARNRLAGRAGGRRASTMLLARLEAYGERHADEVPPQP